MLERNTIPYIADHINFPMKTKRLTGNPNKISLKMKEFVVESCIGAFGDPINDQIIAMTIGITNPKLILKRYPLDENTGFLQLILSI